MLDYLGLDPGYDLYIVRLINKLQRFIDFFLSLLFGFTSLNGWNKDKEKSSTNYESSAHMVNIWTRGALSPLFQHRLENFVCSHMAYLHPSYVLQKDNVTLMSSGPDYVMFSVTRPEFDIYDLVRNPFLFMSHFMESCQLVIMPHWALNRLADELGDPPADLEVIGIGMCARSGSTLLLQMFHRLPNTVVLSEPYVTMHLHEMFQKGSFSEKEFRVLVKSAHRILIKPLAKKNCQRLVIKFQAYIPYISWLKQDLPYIKLIFSTRHPKPCMNSWYNQFQLGPLLRLFYKLGWQQFVKEHGFIDFEDDRRAAAWQDLIQHNHGVATNAGSYGMFLAYYLKHRNVYDYCVIFDDFVSNPTEGAIKLFQALEISTELVPTALTAMEKHSQNDVFFDSTKVKRISDEELGECDYAFEKLDFPFRTTMTMEEFRNVIHNHKYI